MLIGQPSQVSSQGRLSSNSARVEGLLKCSLLPTSSTSQLSAAGFSQIRLILGSAILTFSSSSACSKRTRNGSQRWGTPGGAFPFYTEHIVHRVRIESARCPDRAAAGVRRSEAYHQPKVKASVQLRGQASIDNNQDKGGTQQHILPMRQCGRLANNGWSWRNGA